jgi:hypothetical protein
MLLLLSRSDGIFCWNELDSESIQLVVSLFDLPFTRRMPAMSVLI